MNETRFIYLGDAEPDNFKEPVGYGNWRNLLSEAYDKAYGSSSEKDKCLIVLGGDLVRRSRKEDNWSGFFDALDPFMEKAAVIAAIGNHDCRDGIDYLKRLKTPQNGPQGFEKCFYSYDHGCCHFTVLDTNSLWYEAEYDRMPYYSKKYGFDLPPYDPEIAPVPLISDWLRNDLEKNCDKVKFILMHHPMFSAGISEGDDRRSMFLRENFLPVMKECGADMILCGHQHFYCRTDPVKTGIVQLMSVSGNKLFDGRDNSEMAFVKESVSSASIITADGEGTIRLQSIDQNGNIFDDYTKTRL